MWERRGKWGGKREGVRVGERLGSAQLLLRGFSWSLARNRGGSLRRFWFPLLCGRVSRRPFPRPPIGREAPSAGASLLLGVVLCCARYWRCEAGWFVWGFARGELHFGGCDPGQARGYMGYALSDGVLVRLGGGWDVCGFPRQAGGYMTRGIRGVFGFFLFSFF
jgi:hypothetical protein